MLNAIEKFLREEEGLSAVEYAVAGGVIVVGLLGLFGTLGTAVGGRVTTITGEVG